MHSRRREEPEEGRGEGRVLEANKPHSFPIRLLATKGAASWRRGREAGTGTKPVLGLIAFTHLGATAKHQCCL